MPIATQTYPSGLSFDPHAWAGKRIRPVSGRSRISFDDYSRMGVHSHKQRAERRLPTPIWARDNAALLKLLARFMERRSHLRPGLGSLTARLERAAQARAARVPALERTLRRLCKRYLKRRSAKKRRQIATQIRNLDASICLIQRGEYAVILRAVYLYYRAELDSVGTAAETGIQPPAVRQIFWKMNKLWEKEFALDKPACRSRQFVVALTNRPSHFASLSSRPAPVLQHAGPRKTP